MHVRTCCTTFCDLIPGVEADIANGKILGVLAFQGEICTGAIIGMLDIEGSLENASITLPQVRILFVEVGHQFRGRGTGNLLMERFIHDMQQKDIAAVTVSLYKSHQDRAGFFEKHGFEKCKHDVHDRSKIVLRRNLWSDYGVIDINDDELA